MYSSGAGNARARSVSVANTSHITDRLRVGKLPESNPIRRIRSRQSPDENKTCESCREGIHGSWERCGKSRYRRRDGTAGSRSMRLGTEVYVLATAVRRSERSPRHLGELCSKEKLDITLESSILAFRFPKQTVCGHGVNNTSRGKVKLVSLVLAQRKPGK